MCKYEYIYIFTHIHIYVYIYIYWNVTCIFIYTHKYLGVIDFNTCSMENRCIFIHLFKEKWLNYMQKVVDKGLIETTCGWPTFLSLVSPSQFTEPGLRFPSALMICYFAVYTDAIPWKTNVYIYIYIYTCVYTYIVS